MMWPPESDNVWTYFFAALQGFQESTGPYNESNKTLMNQAPPHDDRIQRLTLGATYRSTGVEMGTLPVVLIFQGLSNSPRPP